MQCRVPSRLVEDGGGDVSRGGRGGAGDLWVTERLMPPPHWEIAPAGSRDRPEWLSP